MIDEISVCTKHCALAGIVETHLIGNFSRLQSNRRFNYEKKQYKSSMLTSMKNKISWMWYLKREEKDEGKGFGKRRKMWQMGRICSVHGNIKPMVLRTK